MRSLPREAWVVLAGGALSSAGTGLTLPCLVVYRAIVRDRRFVRVWLLTALLVTVGYAQVDAAFPAFATCAGGIGAGVLAIANAANTIAIGAAQLFVLRLTEGRRRTPAVVGVYAFFAATWGLTLAAGGLWRRSRSSARDPRRRATASRCCSSSHGWRRRSATTTPRWPPASAPARPRRSSLRSRAEGRVG
ncbi:MAG: hypothetical protein ABI611_19435 [Solirubrobacteraceae bacterium]